MTQSWGFASSDGEQSLIKPQVSGCKGCTVGGSSTVKNLRSLSAAISPYPKVADRYSGLLSTISAPVLKEMISKKTGPSEIINLKGGNRVSTHTERLTWRRLNGGQARTQSFPRSRVTYMLAILFCIMTQTERSRHREKGSVN